MPTLVSYPPLVMDPFISKGKDADPPMDDTPDPDVVKRANAVTAKGVGRPKKWLIESPQTLNEEAIIKKAEEKCLGLMENERSRKALIKAKLDERNEKRQEIKAKIAAE